MNDRRSEGKRVSDRQAATEGERRERERERGRERERDRKREVDRERERETKRETRSHAESIHAIVLQRHRGMVVHALQIRSVWAKIGSELFLM